MKRFLAIVLAAAVGCSLAVEPAAARHSTRSDFIQLTPVPGLSLGIPRGWIACDVDDNRALGNPDHPKLAASMCTRVKSDQKAFIDTDPLHPMAVFVGQANNVPLPEDFIRNASPEAMATLTSQLCQNIRALHQLRTCNLRLVTIGSHPAFEGEVISEDNPADKSAARLLLLSGGRGMYAIVFSMPLSARASAASSIDAILGTLVLDPVVAEPPAEMVSLSAAPGVTVSVPKGWRACDAAANALLGSAADSPNPALNWCDDATASAGYYDPRPFHGESIHVSYVSRMVDANGFARALTPDALAQSRPEDCGKLTKALDGKADVLSCDTQAGSLSGRPAKVLIVVAVMPPTAELPKIKAELRIMDVPYSQGILRVRVFSMPIFQPMTQGDIDAILNSFVIP